MALDATETPDDPTPRPVDPPPDTAPEPKAAPRPAPAIAPGPSFDALMGNMGEVSAGLADIKQREAAAHERIIRQSEGLAAQDRSIAKQHYDAAGVEATQMKPWNAQQEWDKVATSPLEAFGSFASVFAIVASAFTRAPMENALNASAAAMTAIRQGDEKEYERGFSSWKANMDLVQKRFQMQNTLYTDALNLMQTDQNAGRIALQNAALRFGDEKSLFLLRNGMDKDLIDLNTSRINQMKAMSEAREKITDQTFKNQAFEALKNEFRQNHGGQEPNAQQTVDLWKHAHGVTQDWKQKLIDKFLIDHMGEPDLPEKAAKYAQSLNVLGRGSGSELTQHLMRWEEEFTNTQGRAPTIDERLEEIEKFSRAKRTGSGSVDKEWLSSFTEQFKREHDGRSPTADEITEAQASRKAALSKNTGSPENQAFNQWKADYIARVGEEPDSDLQKQKVAEIREAVRRKNLKDQAIEEIRKVHPELSIAEAERQYKVVSKVPNYSAAEQNQLKSTPTLLKHLQTLDWLTDNKQLAINDPTGIVKSLPQNLAAVYFGYNDAQQLYRQALAGARAEVANMASGRGSLKAQMVANLDRLPGDFKDTRFNKGLVQQLWQDTSDESRRFLSTLDRAGKLPSSDLLKDFEDYGIYPPNASRDAPPIMLRERPQELSLEQMRDLARNSGHLPPDDRKRLEKELQRRRAEYLKAHPEETPPEAMPRGPR